MPDRKFEADFAEWRGTVSSALKYINKKLGELRDEDLEQWTVIESIRSQMQACRDRCETLSGGKCSKEDLVSLKDEINTLEKKVEKLKGNVDAQEKAQIKQAVTMTFYGLIGGALFSGIIWLLGVLVKGVK